MATTGHRCRLKDFKVKKSQVLAERQGGQIQLDSDTIKVKYLFRSLDERTMSPSSGVLPLILDGT